MAGQPPCPPRLRPPRRPRARAPPPPRRGPSPHPDDQAVRGVGVRDPPRVGTVGRCRRAVHAGRGLPRRPERQRDGAPPRRRAPRPRPRRVATDARPQDDPCSPHVRPSGRRVAGSVRGARPVMSEPSVTTEGPKNDGLDIAFFGSSLVSAWWNGAATYYRGIIRGLHDLGHHITFYEPIAYERQEHRDIADPEWADVVIYPAEHEDDVRATVERGGSADVVVKTSGVGVFDDVLEDAVAALARPSVTTVFWDVDAPATLGRMEADPDDPFRALLPSYDLVLTYGGGDPVISRYEELGARECIIVYNALDPTTHHAALPDDRFRADLGLLAN